MRWGSMVIRKTILHRKGANGQAKALCIVIMEMRAISIRLCNSTRRSIKGLLLPWSHFSSPD